MKTSDLTGAALDWAVAKCEGREWESADSFIAYHEPGEMNYSTNWSQGGPIIDKFKIQGVYFNNGVWECSMFTSEQNVSHGETFLIAAMRCYASYYFGLEVDVPAELL